MTDRVAKTFVSRFGEPVVTVTDDLGNVIGYVTIVKTPSARPSRVAHSSVARASLTCPRETPKVGRCSTQSPTRLVQPPSPN